jgi:hypothetical protein
MAHSLQSREVILVAMITGPSAGEEARRPYDAKAFVIDKVNLTNTTLSKREKIASQDKSRTLVGHWPTCRKELSGRE